MALSDSIAAAYKLSDATDSEGSIDLTNNNSATFVTGKVGDCVNLNGSSQYLSRATGDLYFTGAFSINCWINIASGSGTKSAVAKFAGAAGFRRFQVRVDNSTLKYYHHTNGTFINLTGPSLSTDTWYMVTITLSGSGSGEVAKMYVDGVYYATQTLNSTYKEAGEQPFNIGISQYGATKTDYFNGKVDDVTLWDGKVLTDGGVSLTETAGGEVAELYNSGSGLEYPFSGGGSGWEGSIQGIEPGKAQSIAVADISKIQSV